MPKIQEVAALLGVGLWVSSVAIGQARKSEAAEQAVSESFGLGDQVLHVGASAFQHVNNASGYEIDWLEDGYLEFDDPAFIGVFVAPLTLPAGAQIFNICMYFYDGSPSRAVGASLDAIKLGGTGSVPGVVPIWISTPIDFAEGYGYVCSATSYTYRETADLDGDGTDDPLVHRLRVEMTESGDGPLKFGGVKVHWRRQISPAPAVATFADIPTSHQYFQYVEALAASGITAGCGGGNFCPTEPLTRVQMAIFLSKALGLHWPN